MWKTSLSNKIAALAALICILVCGFTTANAEGRLFRQVPPGEFSYLPQSTVYDIARSDDGFVWFATDNGLLRFDGSHIIRVAMPGDNVKIKPVKTLAAIRGGELLIGTESHLYRLSAGKNSYDVIPMLEGKAFSATSGLSLDNGGAVVGGDDGLIVYNHGSGITTQKRLGSNVLDMSNNVIDISRMPNAIYVLTKGGIYRLDKSLANVAAVEGSSDVAKYSPTSIACGENSIFVGTSGNGVLAIDPSDGKLTKTGYVDSGSVVTSLDISRDGKTLWIGTDGAGVTNVELASGKINTLRHQMSNPTSLASNQVYTLLSDEQGLLWIGYYQHGVDYTPEAYGLFEVYENPAVFNSRGVPIRALSFGKEYNAVGTREGVVVHNPKTDESWDVGSLSLRSEMVISLLGVGDKIFVGTYGGGMQVLDPRNKRVSDFAPAKDEPVFHNGHVFAIAADGRGGLWAGTNEGLYEFDTGGAVRHFTSYMSALPEGNVYGVFFDSEDKGWICTESGVCIYDPERKTLRSDLFPVSFPRATRFRSVYEDSRKRLYFVPEKGYIYSCGLDFSDPKILDLPMIQGTDAKGVVEDHLGNLWIATNRGIFLVDSSENVVRFGLAAGLPSVSFLQAQPSADSKGVIWFGNAEGLLKLNENLIETAFDKEIIPVPTKVEVNGKVTDIVPRRGSDGSFELNFDSSVNNIKLGFSTLTYFIEEPDEFECKLDDGDWQKFKGGMDVNLYDLKPGKRRLLVRFGSDPQHTQGKETQITLNIPYPMAWKIGLGVIAAMVAISIYLACRVFIVSSRKNADAPANLENEGKSHGEPSDIPVQKKYVSNNMSRAEARNIAARIEEVMKKEKPYLDAELKVGKLAEMVGISSHKLSQFFSQHKNISFYDYVNGYRVDEFKRMLKEEDVRNLTLSAVAEQAGFSSRASFFRYFKNIEGISPGEYMKSHQKPEK